jgi:hypothetical protein
MNLKQLLIGSTLAVALVGVALAAEDAHDGARMKMRAHAQASVEFAAMHNIMTELLSAKTGKTPAEINALFEAGGPPAVAEKLGLKHEEMEPLFKEARATLITRAQAANLITAAQAEKLRAAKVEMHHKRTHDDGDDE